MYIDLPDTNFIETILNSKKLLNDSGFLIFIFRTKNALEKNQNSDNKIDLFNELNHTFQVLQIINLTDFFKEFSMIIAKIKNN